jgi:hypothetical protein
MFVQRLLCSHTLPSCDLTLAHADQNIRWACAHGYALYFLRLAGGGCLHPSWGQRHPSYCKLAAVAHVLSLSAFGSVVYLDSDVMMRNATEASLPELLRRYSAASYQSHYPQSASPAGAQLFFAWDTPYSLGPNAGFFVVHSSAAAREVLRAWWSLDPGPYGLSHAFEQQTLQWILMHTSRYRPLLRTLRLRAIEPPWRDAVHHLDHNTGTKARVWNIARAAAEGLARDPWLPRNESARLQSYLPLLRQSVRGKSMKVRQDVIRLVMAAIGLDLQRIGLASIANTSWGGDRVGHQIVHTSASCAGSVYMIPHFDATRSAAELLKPMLESSPQARQLELAQPAAWEGLPLQLRNCSHLRSDRLAAWQSWEFPSMPKQQSAKGKRSRDGRMLTDDDMSYSTKTPPTHADADGAHTEAGHVEKGLRLALQAVPRACLALGGTRAHKKPYAPLAVLHRCQKTSSRRASPRSAVAAQAAVVLMPGASPVTRGMASAAGAAAGSDAIRQSVPLMLNGSTMGQIRTSHPLATLRTVVPSFHGGCGFWPNCTSTLTVLPKPCWAHLGLNAASGFRHTTSSADIVHACGAEEPALLNAAHRLDEVEGGGAYGEHEGRRQGEVTTHVGTSEPLSEPTTGPQVYKLALGPSGPEISLHRDSLGDFPRMALCLTTWRGQLVDGAPLVFSRCPTLIAATSHSGRSGRSAARQVANRSNPGEGGGGKGRRLQVSHKKRRTRKEAQQQSAKAHGWSRTRASSQDEGVRVASAAHVAQTHSEQSIATNQEMKQWLRSANHHGRSEGGALPITWVATPAANGLAGRTRQGIRLSPSLAPHLCLTAPPMATVPD